jgi:hypothetical protein
MDIPITNKPKFELFQTVYFLDQYGIHEFFITGIEGGLNHYNAEDKGIDHFYYYSKISTHVASNKKHENVLYTTKEDIIKELST